MVSSVVLATAPNDRTHARICTSPIGHSALISGAYLRSCVWRYMFKEKPQGRQARRRGAKPDAAYRMHVQENGYPNPLQGELDTMPI